MKHIESAAQARGKPGTGIHHDGRKVPALFAVAFLLAAFLSAPGQSALAAEQSGLGAGTEQWVAMARVKPSLADKVTVPDARPADLRELNSLIAEGQRLEQAGKYAEALIPFYAARNQATEADQQSLVMLLDYSISGAHWRLYQQTGHPAQLRAAIRHWEHERDLYAAQNYAVGFRGLVLYDLAGGYLALAAHEELGANLGRAAQTLKEAQALLKGDATVRVQHILAARMQPFAR